MKKWFDIYFPRFTTEATAFIWDEEEETFYPVCSMKDVMEGERFDAVGVVRGFNFFNTMISWELVGGLVEWDEWE